LSCDGLFPYEREISARNFFSGRCSLRFCWYPSQEYCGFFTADTVFSRALQFCVSLMISRTFFATWSSLLTVILDPLPRRSCLSLLTIRGLRESAVFVYLLIYYSFSYGTYVTYYGIYWFRRSHFVSFNWCFQICYFIIPFLYKVACCGGLLISSRTFRASVNFPYAYYFVVFFSSRVTCFVVEGSRCAYFLSSD
jgi:hypothetical protein